MISKKEKKTFTPKTNYPKIQTHTKCKTKQHILHIPIHTLYTKVKLSKNQSNISQTKRNNVWNNPKGTRSTKNTSNNLPDISTLHFFYRSNCPPSTHTWTTKQHSTTNSVEQPPQFSCGAFRVWRWSVLCSEAPVSRLSLALSSANTGLGIPPLTN